MANLSDLTRAEQVLKRLQDADGGWVDTVEISNAQVGGSEGTKRLRELRDAGHDIRKRKKPGSSDQYQYRLVPPVRSTFIVDPSVEVEEHPRVDISIPIEPAETYDYTPERPTTSRVHLGKDESGKYIAVSDAPPPGQTQAFDNIEIVGDRFTSMPTHLELGRTVICPACHAHRRFKKKLGVFEDFTRDPIKTEEKCRRCGGFGVVPR